MLMMQASKGRLLVSHLGALPITLYVYSAGLAMTHDGECNDHVVVGTRAGDCLFLDTEHDGQVMLCFPAHRSYCHQLYLNF